MGSVASGSAGVVTAATSIPLDGLPVDPRAQSPRTEVVILPNGAA